MLGWLAVALAAPPAPVGEEITVIRASDRWTIVVRGPDGEQRVVIPVPRTEEDHVTLTALIESLSTDLVLPGPEGALPEAGLPELPVPEPQEAEPAPAPAPAPEPRASAPPRRAPKPPAPEPQEAARVAELAALLEPSPDQPRFRPFPEPSQASALPEPEPWTPVEIPEPPSTVAFPWQDLGLWIGAGGMARKTTAPGPHGALGLELDAGVVLGVRTSAALPRTTTIAPATTLQDRTLDLSACLPWRLLEGCAHLGLVQRVFTQDDRVAARPILPRAGLGVFAAHRGPVGVALGVLLDQDLGITWIDLKPGPRRPFPSTALRIEGRLLLRVPEPR